MSAPREPGTILSGKFRIDRVLGQGGMGVVVAAHHLRLDERVAIKFLLPEALANREAVARFEREARAAVKIKSEHIVRVSDVGTLDDGAPYMVMEYLHGRDLGALLQQRGPLPLEDVADYLLQACEAIAEAHALGIVHRDLKPPNLFLTERADGSTCIKVLDFGISKVTNSADGSGNQGMTATSAVMGSPLYMSPEQLSSSKDVDMRTDIWALGVMLYELLTASTPFKGETLAQLCTAVLTAPPGSVRAQRPEIPAGVDQLIVACLEKDRGKRVPTVSEFANRLVPFAPKRSRVSAERIERVSRAAGFSASAPALPPSSNDGPVETAAPNSTFTEFGKTAGGASSSRLWIFAAVTVVALGVGTFVVTRGPGAPDPSASGATSSSVSRPPVEEMKPVAPLPEPEPVTPPTVEVRPATPVPSASAAPGKISPSGRQAGPVGRGGTVKGGTTPVPSAAPPRAGGAASPGPPPPKSAAPPSPTQPPNTLGGRI